MKRLAVFIFIGFLFFLFAKKAFAASWYYPMTNVGNRASLKEFGMLVNDDFYQGKETLFPTKFYGYHAGQDLETFDNEKQNTTLVPFYAVADGTITYFGNLGGWRNYPGKTFRRTAYCFVRTCKNTVRS